MADEQETLTLAAVELGRKGGKKTAERGPKYYAEIQAKRETRAGGRPKNPPKAIYEGQLTVGGVVIPCAVLEDGTRLLTQSGFMQALGRARQAKGRQYYDADVNMPAFLTAKNLKPFISKELEVTSSQIEFITMKGIRAFGYPADLLPKVCDVFWDAEKAGALTAGQKHIAEQAKLLIRGLAHVGIIALVDEATGYQYVRVRNALEEILDKFIASEFRKWVKTFPDDFYREMFRLRGWEFKEDTVRKTPLVGKFTLDLVYDRLAPGVRQRLQELNPKNERGNRKHKLFQRLTEDVGDPSLRAHLAAVIALMKAADDWDTFMRAMKRALPK